MNKTLVAAVAALVALAGFATTASAQVGVSITLGQPGFYGRIDLGDAPRPRIYYREPRLYDRVAIEEEPIYLHVRRGETRNWGRHCRKYDACGRRVYFVNHAWYNDVYVPHYRDRSHRNARRGDRHDDRRGDRHDDRRGHRDDDHRDDHDRRRDQARRDDDRRYDEDRRDRN